MPYGADPEAEIREAADTKREVAVGSSRSRKGYAAADSRRRGGTENQCELAAFGLCACCARAARLP
ncbi:hypothetical protein B0G76_3394 [Paraburkholderia sp. BL23I1N1]|nr:hypothetical protein B0G76_3394 [Paraburkholderia sp. BL23I1N1]